jgi:endonuclease G
MLGACAAPPGAEDSGLLPGLLGDEAIIAGQIMVHGYPGKEMLLYRPGYVLSYDAQRRVPRWVAERLDKSALVADAPEGDRHFRVDESVPAAWRTETDDYASTGFVRARLAAAPNHFANSRAVDATYLLSNVAPQFGESFRQTVWKELESAVRAWAKEGDGLFVVTGTLFLPTNWGDKVTYPLISNRSIAVPTHFYKVLFRRRGHEADMIAFLVPHQPTPAGSNLLDFAVTVDRLEAISGLDFFPKLGEPTQADLEKNEPAALWPFPVPQ